MSMRDEALATETSLTKAEAAVSYILQRIRVDADLRWLMIGTEAFSRLCHAEAERTGKSFDEVREEFSKLAKRCERDVPRVVAFRRLAEQLYEAARRDSISRKELLEMTDNLSRI